MPIQLRGLKFCRIRFKTKKPFEKDWVNNPYTYEQIKEFDNENYGILTGGEKNLLVVDFDNKELQEELLKKLPETFMVKTGSGLFHLYYFSDNPEGFKIFDKDMNTLADIQGEGRQVIGVNSTHPNGNKYELYKDVPIAFIDYAELKAYLKPHDKKPKKVEEKKKQEPIQSNDFVDECKNQISIRDVLNMMGVDTSKNPTECPFHSSKAGKCLGFKDDVAHCFHCDDSWNIFSLVKQWKNCDFKEALEILADKFGLQDKLEESKKAYMNKAAQVFTMKNQAQQFTDIQPLFYDRAGMFWLWDSEVKCWKISDEVDILNMIEESTGKDVITPKNRTEIINALKQKGRKNIPKPIQPTWIQFKDKIYDITTGESFEATPEYFVTNPIPYAVSHDPTTPNMDRIFEEWVGKDYVPTLKQIISYCLLPDYPIHRLFCFIGAGLNGKSKFLDLLRKFIGFDNVCSTELDTLMTSRFEVTRLHKKLVCQMGETNFNEMNRTSVLKKLTGGDLIGFEYKNKNPFEEKNYAKILISTNNLPVTNDKTIGFYRRWLIIDFPNRFSEQKNILEDIPEEEYSNLASNSILVLNELLQVRAFHKEGTVEERMEKFEAKSDFLQKFLDDFTIKGNSDDCYIIKAEFHRKFKEWCKENRHRELAENSLGRKMKEKGYEHTRKQLDWTEDGKGGLTGVWLDIKWKV